MTSRRQQIQPPGGKVIVAAVTAVAAVYVYFLIFAQFGFLKAVQATVGESVEVIRPIMAAMGLAGVTGSVFAARVFSEQNCRHWLGAGFGACVAASGMVLGVKNSAGLLAVAGLTGLGVGFTTVTLAGMLRRAVGEAHLGVIIGLGTGLAYGFCNLPAIFDTSATTHAQLALLAVVAGLIGAGRSGRAWWWIRPGAEIMRAAGRRPGYWFSSRSSASTARRFISSSTRRR